MKSLFRPATAGLIGMSGALLFFVGLIIEYRYGLFPPGNGLLFMMNQIQFFLAMGAIVVMMWGMREMKAGGSGRFGRLSLTAFPIGWAALILGGVIGQISGNYDNLFFPLGGLTVMVFGLLAGIAVVTGKQWLGWTRYVPLVQGLYYLLVMMILPLLLTGSNEPTFLTESLWMATWFLMGVALFRQAKQGQLLLTIQVGY